MRHAVRSVRLAVVRMIGKLIESNEQNLQAWLPTIFSDLMQLFFQNFVLEEHQVCPWAKQAVLIAPSLISALLNHRRM